MSQDISFYQYKNDHELDRGWRFLAVSDIFSEETVSLFKGITADILTELSERVSALVEKLTADETDPESLPAEIFYEIYELDLEINTALGALPKADMYLSTFEYCIELIQRALDSQGLDFQMPDPYKYDGVCSFDEWVDIFGFLQQEKILNEIRYINSTDLNNSTSATSWTICKEEVLIPIKNIVKECREWQDRFVVLVEPEWESRFVEQRVKKVLESVHTDT